MNPIAFSTLNLQVDLLSNLEALGYESMTPIQAQSLPDILVGCDVIGQGKTGSGKTAAFGLGLLQALDVRKLHVQSLVLCPTRELADQVAKEIRKLARSIGNVKILSLCGGVSIRPQKASLTYGAHIIVGTPGRIEDHVNRGTLKLGQLSILVLDEADRMLEMGFQSAVDAIVATTPKQRQTLLFSATFTDQIKTIAKRIMHKPKMVQVESTHDENVIAQHFYKVAGNEVRADAVRLLLLQHRPESTIVFCNTKRETQDVADELTAHGFSVLALHGDIEQRDRDQTMVRFANKSVSILVATDVAARGLDIEALDMVINYHIAQDPEVHIHRMGRTGRAGKQGMVCSLFSDKEHFKMTVLGDYLEREIKSESLPSSESLKQAVFKPVMATLQIHGGKKQKVRPGDILGALTGEQGISGHQVGKIHIFDHWAYVAVHRDVSKIALKKLDQGTLKGRSFRVRLLWDWVAS